MSLPGDLRGLLFDLDGTLVDTAPDLAAALNRLRREHGLPPLPLAQVRPRVSLGTPGVLGAGMRVAAGDPRFATLRARLLAHYRSALCVHSALMPGIEAVLERLEARQIPWGIVTNKPGWLTTPLVAALGLARRAACVVCGDSAKAAKPDPAPLLLAARRVGIAPQALGYVGDAERDMRAARAAGMLALGAGWGYIPPEEDIAAWGADHVFTSPVDLVTLLPSALATDDAR